jgi:hypothetical protein
MDYYIIATHQERGTIKAVRYITSLDDSRLLFEKRVDEVMNDIRSTICRVFTATRKSDGTYKIGSPVTIRSNYIVTVGNKRSGDNLDNLPRY